ncbi:hypothetical protein HPB48_000344 [Haemaphysalis longicornis]|uniref:Rho GTPase-activating protein pG1 and pG2 domain-containing protein n=1 Tax=Haemaphysalis longicornis TaxID=44386 RepID=A0A9J6FBX8_HAELO|nr:hypothetical protein HPB48_000344 [Haemaphysalis longicornis]
MHYCISHISEHFINPKRVASGNPAEIARRASRLENHGHETTIIDSAQQVAQAMRQVHPQGFQLDDKAQYALDFRIIDGDVGLPHKSFRTEPLPQGCLCVYPSQPGLEYIRESLEKTLLANLEQEDRLPFHGLPLVMLFAGQALCALVESIERRAGRLHIFQALPAAAGPRPDLRLMLCILCGTPVEDFLRFFSYKLKISHRYYQNPAKGSR